MKRACSLLVLLAACAGNPPPSASTGGIRDVVVVLKGSSRPLPFDPRGGRLTVVTREVTALVGHPVVFELDTALSPALVASLEETVLASFETLVRELVLLRKEDPESFAHARRIERVVFVYDAVAKGSEATLAEDGTRLVVRSPPDRFPLLEPWVLSSAVQAAAVKDLDARWGEADPARLAPREQRAWFEYMTKTRPGAGYLWIANRAKRSGSWEDLRAEHVARIMQLVPADPSLARKVRRFLVESASYVGDLAHTPHGSPRRRAYDAYVAWLERSLGAFDDDEKLVLERALVEHETSFPDFDRLAFGLAVFDAWVKEGAPMPPRSDVQKGVVCGVKRRSVEDADDAREIHYSCSRLFAAVVADEGSRRRLAETIARRRDTKLLEVALFSARRGPEAISLLDGLGDEALFRHGFDVLFHDHARRDDVKSALDDAAPRWWRDAPGRRALPLLVIARRTGALHVHYGDNQWTRFVGEYGGPIAPSLLAAFLATGTRAVELAPTMWPALAKGTERDELVARSLPVLLAQDREARTTRTPPVLSLLRRRLCAEKNAAAMARVRSVLERWRGEHPDDAATVANAIQDFTLARCVPSD